MNLKERAKQLTSAIPALFLALKDKRTPALAKILAAITVAYALSPIDLIPDFVPVLGYLDDLLILPLLAAAAIKAIPQDVFEENRQKATDLWQSGKPHKWYFAVPIVLFWVLIVTAVVFWLIKKRTM